MEEYLAQLDYSTTLTYLLGTLAVTLLLAFLRFKSSDTPNLPPGPRGLEALLSMLSALREGSLNTQTERWRRQYGPLVLCRSAFGDLVVLNLPHLVRELFAGKDTEHLISERPWSFFGSFVTYGFKAVGLSGPSYRKEWPKMRKMFHRAVKFYGDGVGRMEETVQEELRRLISELEGKECNDVDMDQVLSSSIMRVVITLVSGEYTDHNLAEAAKRYDKLGKLLINPITDAALSSLPWLRHVPFLRYKKMCRDVISARDHLMEGLFTHAKETRVPGKPRGITDIMLDEQEKGENQWMTDDHIRGILLDTIAAAYLTSLQTLKALFLYLVHNPQVVQRIQKDIDATLGEKTPRIQDRSSLPYVEAVVWETMRFASPGTTTLPHLTSGDLTVDGYTIPKGSSVLANIYECHHNPNVFPDPEKFLPERFLDDNGQLLPANHPVRQSMVTFGIGKRSCIGESFARSRVFLYVTTLFQHFDILPPKQHQLLPPTRSAWKNGIVLELKPYHVIFRPRA